MDKAVKALCRVSQERSHSDSVLVELTDLA
jgi:hypothetical protein